MRGPDGSRLSKRDAVPDDTYAELVRDLFRSQLPTVIMSIAFVVVAALLVGGTQDRMLAVLGQAGAVSAAIRLIVLLVLGRSIQDDSVSHAGIRRIERVFAAAYLMFAGIFGAFAARAIIVVPLDHQMLMVALLVGYAAGVAAGASLRPWIGMPAVMMAVLPTIIACLFKTDVTHWALSALLVALLVGGLHSMISRYHHTASSITMRRLFSTLARSDGLTGLPNRLALVEHFARSAGDDRGVIAVHCLDLDRFKPINDRFGHPVGDLLLQAVAERLRRLLRELDFAARVGGDEFIIVQRGVAHPGEAELLARRMVRSLSEPYQIGHRALQLGASVGFALSSEHGFNLERLVESADRALLRAKAEGGGLATGNVLPEPKLTRVV